MQEGEPYLFRFICQKYPHEEPIIPVDTKILSILCLFGPVRSYRIRFTIRIRQYLLIDVDRDGVISFPFLGRDDEFPGIIIEAGFEFGLDRTMIDDGPSACILSPRHVSPKG